LIQMNLEVETIYTKNHEDQRPPKIYSLAPLENIFRNLHTHYLRHSVGYQLCPRGRSCPFGTISHHSFPLLRASSCDSSCFRFFGCLFFFHFSLAPVSPTSALPSAFSLAIAVGGLISDVVAIPRSILPGCPPVVSRLHACFLDLSASVIRVLMAFWRSHCFDFDIQPPLVDLVCCRLFRQPHTLSVSRNTTDHAIPCLL
jgi:hypothetical protein